MKRREAEEKMAWPSLKIKLALVPMDPGTSGMAIRWWKMDGAAAAAVAWTGIEIPVASLKWWQRWWYYQWRRSKSCRGPPLLSSLFILVTSVFKFEFLPGRNHRQTHIDNLVVMYSGMVITCRDLEEFAYVVFLIPAFWDVHSFWGKDSVLKRSPWVVRLLRGIKLLVCVSSSSSAVFWNLSLPLSVPLFLENCSLT